MSFDLKLFDGDINFDELGETETVIEYRKMKQAVLAILTLPIGQNAYHPGYGCGLAYMGTTNGYDEEIRIRDNASSMVRSALNNLIALQASQELSQYLSPRERILSVKSVDVSFDEEDPRLLNIFIKLITGDLNTVFESVTVRLS